VFACLPPHERARAALVCRAWRDVSYDVSLWMRLDLSRMRDAWARTDEDDDATLVGAAARARGSLQELDVSHRDVGPSAVVLLPALAALNARTLRTLRLGRMCVLTKRCWYNAHELARLLQRLRALAPRLTQLEAAELTCGEGDVFTLLGGEFDDRARALETFVRVRLLTLRQSDNGDDGARGAPAVSAPAALGAVLARANKPAAVAFEEVRLEADGALDALVDGMRSGDTGVVASVAFTRCDLGRAPAPALARLLAGDGAPERLEVVSAAHVAGAHWQPHVPVVAPLGDDDDTAELGSALRANDTLTALTLSGVLDFWRGGGVAAALLDALTGHATLRTIDVSRSGLTRAAEELLPALLAGAPPAADADAAPVAAALGALLAADAPALTELDVSGSELGGGALRPLFAALRSENRHLRALSLRGCRLDAAFMRDVALPTVRANACLRRVDVSSPALPPDDASVAELAALLRSRGGGE
jgi:hypothetical protein